MNMHRYANLGFREKGAEVADLFLQVVPNALPITKEDAVRAPTLYRTSSQPQARDAIHAAVMEGNGLTIIVTADRHLDQFAGVRRVDPAGFEEFLRENH